jgi:hypothetical protein
MNDESTQRALSTADLAAAARPEQAHARAAASEHDAAAATPVKTVGNGHPGGEALAPLFVSEMAQDFRTRWEAVQTSFVDDPAAAVRHGDELVAQVMKSLAETFSNERAKLEEQLGQSNVVSTEDLRIAFRRYRSFFERLLAL